MTAVSRASLPLLEETLVWCMRAWVTGYLREISVAARIDNVFGGLRAPEAALPFDGFLYALSCGVTWPLDIACPCKPDVTADEAELLDILALAQEGQDGAARRHLGRLARPGAAAAAFGCVGRLMHALNAAGHHLPRAAEAVRRG